MVEKTEIIPEEISLFHIEVHRCIIKDIKSDKTKYNLNVGSSVMHNLEDERIKIGLAINLSTKEESNSVIADFMFDFHFQIKNLKNFYELKDDQEPRFSGLLIVTLLGLSFSTARGILFEKLAGSNLQGIILPVIDPKKLLTPKTEEHK